MSSRQHTSELSFDLLIKKGGQRGFTTEKLNHTEFMVDLVIRLCGKNTSRECDKVPFHHLSSAIKNIRVLHSMINMLYFTFKSSSKAVTYKPTIASGKYCRDTRVGTW